MGKIGTFQRKKMRKGKKSEKLNGSESVPATPCAKSRHKRKKHNRKGGGGVEEAQRQHLVCNQHTHTHTQAREQNETTPHAHPPDRHENSKYTPAKWCRRYTSPCRAPGCSYTPDPALYTVLSVSQGVATATPPPSQI